MHALSGAPCVPGTGIVVGEGGGGGGGGHSVSINKVKIFCHDMSWEQAWDPVGILGVSLVQLPGISPDTEYNLN